MQSTLEFMLISFLTSEFMFDLLPAVSSGTGMEWGWNKYWRGRTGMELKLCGDGWGWVWFLSTCRSLIWI